MTHRNWTLETKLVHNQAKTDAATGAVSVPIQHASTFHQASFDRFGEYDYSRSGTPTRKALEDAIAEFEGGTRGFAFSSGMAAISTAFLLLSKGDHVLVTKDVYGGTYRMITEVMSRFGIEHTFVDMTDLNEIALNIKENTKVIYLETPSNPTLGITDIRGVVKLAKAHGCLTFLDNTFMTPALQRPLELGVDVVLHSATKFLSGHSDVLSGLAVVKDKKLGEALYKLQNSFGAVFGVQDCWLVLRGLKTLQVRLETPSSLPNFLRNIRLSSGCIIPDFLHIRAPLCISTSQTAQGRCSPLNSRMPQPSKHLSNMSRSRSSPSAWAQSSRFFRILRKCRMPQCRKKSEKNGGLPTVF